MKKKFRDNTGLYSGLMASGEDGIQSTTPQFSETAYEIPSWQIPWNRPWYQRFDDHSKNKGQNTCDYVRNDKGHELNCKCCRCEEELDSAFTPQANNSTNFIHFPNYGEEDDVERGGDSAKNESNILTGSFTPANSQNRDVNNSQNSSKIRAGGPEKVILLSDLEEVRPSTASDTDTDVIRPTSETARGSNSTGNASDTSSGNNDGMSSFSADSLLNSFGALATLQSVSDRSKTLQQKIENFRPETDDGRESLVLRGLLVSCLAEIQRVNSTEIEWLQTAKNMVKIAVEEMLEKLEEKIRNNPHCQGDNY